MDQRLSVIRNLRRIGFAEGLSFIVLVFIAMPLKHMADMPMAVRIVGSIHGFLFLLFLWALWRVHKVLAWDVEKLMGSFIASILPFGTFVADARTWKKEQAALTAR